MKLAHILLITTLISIIIGCSSDNTPEPVTVGPEPAVATPFTGQVNWTKTIGGSLSEEAKDIVFTNDGGYVVMGNAESIDGDLTDHETGTHDFWVMKLDVAGNLLWNKTYGGSDDDRGEAIAHTQDGGFIITGYSRSRDNDISKNSGSYDHWIVRLDGNGTLLWEKSYGYPGDDRAFAVIQTEDGGFMTAGFLSFEEYDGPNKVTPEPGKKSKVIKHGVGEFWVHKLDKNGDLEWERFYGGTSNDRANDLIATDDSGFLIVGSTESADNNIAKNNGSYDFWVIKIDKTGTLLWEKTYGGSGTETAYAITKTKDGNYIIVGDTRSEDGDVSRALGNADFWVIKINPTGGLIWEQTYGGSDFDAARDVVAAKDGGYIISGSSKSSDGHVSKNTGSNDFWMIKIDNESKVQWNASYGGSALDFGYGVTEDVNGNIIVVGDTESADNDIKENKGKKDAFVVSIKPTKFK